MTADCIPLSGMRLWLVTRYEDVEMLLTNPSVSVNAEHASEEAWTWSWIADSYRGDQSSNLARVDPPGHTRLRRMVSREFTTRRLEALRPYIREVAEAQLAGFLARGRVELMGEYAR